MFSCSVHGVTCGATSGFNICGQQLRSNIAIVRERCDTASAPQSASIKQHCTDVLLQGAVSGQRAGDMTQAGTCSGCCKGGRHLLQLAALVGGRVLDHSELGAGERGVGVTGLRLAGLHKRKVRLPPSGPTITQVAHQGTSIAVQSCTHQQLSRCFCDATRAGESWAHERGYGWTCLHLHTVQDGVLLEADGCLIKHCVARPVADIDSDNVRRALHTCSVMLTISQVILILMLLLIRRERSLAYPRFSS